MVFDRNPISKQINLFNTWQVRMEPPFSESMASFIQKSLLISTPAAPRDWKARSMIFCTMALLPLASSSLAAEIQMPRSVGMCSRAVLSTFLAFSYVSSLASASHSSVEDGQHSTALARRILGAIQY